MAKSIRRVTAGRAAAALAASRRRYRIEFSVKPYRPGHRYVYPLLFADRDAAQSYLDLVGGAVFFNARSPTIDGVRKIVSCTIGIIQLSANCGAAA